MKDLLTEVGHKIIELDRLFKVAEEVGDPSLGQLKSKQFDRDFVTGGGFGHPDPTGNAATSRKAAQRSRVMTRASKSVLDALKHLDVATGQLMRYIEADPVRAVKK